jgi:hypothetical protein
MRNILIFILLNYFYINSNAQKLSFITEFGNRITTTYQDDQISGVIFNPFDTNGWNGNNDDYFKVYFTPNYQWGCTLRYCHKKKIKGIEVGIYQTGYTTLATVDSHGAQRYGKYAYGKVFTKFHQLEVPIRFSFPIYLIRHPTQYQRDQKAGKKLKFLTGSIGIFTSFIGKDFKNSTKRGRIDKIDNKGILQNMQYELRPATHNKVGFGLEFGLAHAWQLNKHLKFILSSRATLGITPMATYEFVYLISYQGESGNTSTQIKSDNINLNIGLSYDF